LHGLPTDFSLLYHKKRGQTIAHRDRFALWSGIALAAWGIAARFAARFAGWVCVDGPTVCVGVDRQSVTRLGTPAQIDALIREEVRQLGRVEGGLMMVYGLYPGVPLENVAALMDAMTRYVGVFS